MDLDQLSFELSKTPESLKDTLSEMMESMGIDLDEEDQDSYEEEDE